MGQSATTSPATTDPFGEEDDPFGPDPDEQPRREFRVREFYPYSPIASWCVFATGLPAESLAILAYVCGHLNLLTGKITTHVSRKIIAHRFSRSVDWVDKWVKPLVDSGAMIKEPYFAASKHGAQAPNDYTVQLTPPQGMAHPGPISAAEYYKPERVEARLAIYADETPAATQRPGVSSPDQHQASAQPQQGAATQRPGSDQAKPGSRGPSSNGGGSRPAPARGAADKRHLQEDVLQEEVRQEDEGCSPPSEKNIPPSPQPPAQTESLDDELAMFSEPVIALVTDLYERALAMDNAKPLTLDERAGLARRIDARLTEGWSVTRVRGALLNGGCADVRFPARFWAERLDGMPKHPGQSTVASMPPVAIPEPRNGHHRPGGKGQRAGKRGKTNDCSGFIDPNPGRTSYEIPDPERPYRLIKRWANENDVPAWCASCDADSRTLRPEPGGSRPRPCPKCHPEPALFPEHAALPAAAAL